MWLYDIINFILITKKKIEKEFEWILCIENFITFIDTKGKVIIISQDFTL